MKRIATALVLIPVVVWLILAAPAWALIAAMVVVGLFALREVVEIGGERIRLRARRRDLHRRRMALRLLSARGKIPHWLLFAFLLCWAGDTAALYVGKNFRTPQARTEKSVRVKTWEGAMPAP